MAEIDLEIVVGAPVVEEIDTIAAHYGVDREDVIVAALADFVRGERCCAARTEK